MRALLVHPGPSFSVADVYNGWVKGLRQVGVDVLEFNLGDRIDFYVSAKLLRDGEHIHAFNIDAAVQVAMYGIEQACYEWWPDVVIVVSGFFLNEPICELLRKRGHKLAVIHTESPYEDDRQLRAAPWADVNIVNDPTNLEQFQTIGPAAYLPHCYDPDIHYPRPVDPTKASSFFFCGTGYPSRVAFFEQVDWTGINAMLAGNWQAVERTSPLLPLLANAREECLPNDETADWYCSTLTSCNLYRTEAERPELEQGWALGPREVELPACGTWFARQARGESDLLFPMLPTFATPAELGDVIRWALAHPDARAEGAAKAFEAVADRTFDRNAADLLNLLEL